VKDIRNIKIPKSWKRRRMRRKVIKKGVLLELPYLF
jgi:hypothetical protein